MTTILHLTASGRYATSASRSLSTELVERLSAQNPGANVVSRDVAAGVEFVDEAWIEANFTPAQDRSASQATRLAASDALVAEIKAADHIVIATPIYNFSVPGTLKAWIDQVCRAGVTFRYEPTGPVGLLEGKKAYVVVTSGGTEVQSPMDFATDYLRHVLGFVGIDDVSIIAANQLMMDEAAGLAKARSSIAEAA